jgi:uncharacterized membrane protein
MSNPEVVGVIRTVIEWAALGIEILGASVIVAGVMRVAITRGTVRYLFQLDKPGAYESYKHQMGKSLLLGLEFLVAGDVVRTVALDPTLNNVAVLGLLVLVRTFLSWSLTVEIEGRWPWQARTEQDTHVRTIEQITQSGETAGKPDSRESQANDQASAL